MGGNTTRAAWRGSQTLRSREQKEQWPTSGGIANIPVAVCGGVPDALEEATKSAVAHKWPHWLHRLCYLGGPQRFTEWEKITW